MNDIVEQVLGYLRGIWRNRWYAMACAWLVCMLGWVVVYILPDQYQASARVFVDTQTILRPVLQGLTVDLNPNAQIELITRTLFSRPNLEKIAQLTKLDLQNPNPEAREQMLIRLQKRINLTRSGPDLYTILYEDPDPQLAKRMVETVVGVFEQNLVGNTQQSTDTAQRFLDEQIGEYERRLVEAENRLKEFKLKNAGRMPSEGQSYYTRMQQIASDLEMAKLELAQAENRRNVLRQELDRSLQQQFKGEGGQAVVLPIDERIHGLEQKLDNLLVQYTDKHPDISMLRQTIANLKKQRKQEQAEYAARLTESSGGGGASNQKAYSFLDELKVKIAEEEANIASLQVRADEYRRRHKELQNQVSILPGVEAELTALNRDYDMNRKKYDDLVSRRDSLRLSEQAEQSKQEVRYKVVEPPRVPLQPTSPKRLLLISLVLAAGLGAGLGLAFLLTQLWPIFDNPRELMEVTNRPVFGSVGMILSPPALRRERRLMIVYALLGGMLLAAYGGLIFVERASWF